MSNIKIEVSLDTADQKTVKAFADFLYSLSGGTPATVKNTEASATEIEEEQPAPSPATTAPATRTRASRAKVKEEPKVEESEETPVKEEPAKAVKEEKESSISLTDIRTNMSQKIEDHRDAIAKKMKGYGAKNITTLQPENYEDFNDFILSL